MRNPLGRPAHRHGRCQHLSCHHACWHRHQASLSTKDPAYPRCYYAYLQSPSVPLDRPYFSLLLWDDPQTACHSLCSRPRPCSAHPNLRCPLDRWLLSFPTNQACPACPSVAHRHLSSCVVLPTRRQETRRPNHSMPGCGRHPATKNQNLHRHAEASQPHHPKPDACGCEQSFASRVAPSADPVGLVQLWRPQRLWQPRRRVVQHCEVPHRVSVKRCPSHRPTGPWTRGKMLPCRPLCEVATATSAIRRNSQPGVHKLSAQNDVAERSPKGHLPPNWYQRVEGAHHATSAAQTRRGGRCLPDAHHSAALVAAALRDTRLHHGGPRSLRVGGSHHRQCNRHHQVSAFAGLHHWAYLRHNGHPIVPVDASAHHQDLHACLGQLRTSHRADHRAGRHCNRNRREDRRNGPHALAVVLGQRVQLELLQSAPGRCCPRNLVRPAVPLPKEILWFLGFAFHGGSHLGRSYH
mmetsp:Transcript_121325/g.302789  ORF Transcript_121325/g.302789 Transcript_121325/m.302789 type:complete len:465 (+) Transcript_121325:260-1654(+)